MMMLQNGYIEDISISKDASNAIKGLLIVLVVLGHNSILCHKWVGCEISSSYFYWRLLYTFHVYCFFVLPFLYNTHSYRRGNFMKYALRLLYPYLWICLLCVVLYLFILGNPFKGWKYLLQAVLYGDEKMLGENIGFNFPWFLPAMFTLLLLKDIYYSIRKAFKGVLMGIGLLLWLIVIVFDLKFSELGRYVPFALVPAFRLLPVCLITVWMVTKIRFNIKGCVWLIGVFALLSFLFCYFSILDITIGRMAFYFVMPICFFLILIAFKDYLSKSRLLVALGRVSLQIYLYHVFVFNVLLVVVKHFHCPPTLLDGFIVLIITFVVSCLMAVVTIKIPFLKQCFYPQLK